MPLKPDNRPPNQMRHGDGKRRAGADEILSDLDDSLEATHARLKRALAVQAVRIEKLANAGGLTTSEIDQLQQLANAWRVLQANAPPPDLSEMSVEELERQREAVKARAEEK
jgi:hypothetical protein